MIDEAELDDGLPWYHDIYQFLRFETYPKVASTKDKRTLRQLATRFVICGETLYKRSTDEMLLLCLDHTFAEIEMGSLRIALEQQILEADWAQA